MQMKKHNTDGDLSLDLADIDCLPPSPSAMIESMRAYGYSFPMAIADLIDNSISAGAKNIWLHFHWSGRDSWLSITDDGCGMSETSLISAMRLGSQNPLDERSQNDLGRYGLGMKTASFSQCRRLTVLSLHKDSRSIRRWDLDFIAECAKQNQDEWLLLKSPAEGSEKRLSFKPKLENGTIILWENIDRIVDDAPISDDNAQHAFHQQIEHVRKYLAMIFHRFLEGNRPQLKIFINGSDPHHRVKAWNPFFDWHACTDRTPEDIIDFNGKRIKLRGYILPHKDRIEKEIYKDASGPRGWNAQQGFYVYRNQRLLVAGSWLGLGHGKPWTKEEHYKLARIQIDIPNSMDQDWQIDVKKSVAVPPIIIRNRLIKLADEVRKRARSVFSHRGRYGPRTAKNKMIRPWSASTIDGRPVYKIDRAHPLVAEVLKLSGDRRHITEALFEVIEETVPVQRIWLDTAEKPEAHLLPFEHKTKKEIQRTIRYTYEALLGDGRTSEEAVAHILMQEEFSEYHDLIKKLEDYSE